MSPVILRAVAGSLNLPRDYRTPPSHWPGNWAFGDAIRRPDRLTAPIPGRRHPSLPVPSPLLGLVLWLSFQLLLTTPASPATAAGRAQSREVGEETLRLRAG